MAERRVSVPVRYSFDGGLTGMYGAPVLSGTALDAGFGLYASAQPYRHFTARARIAWDDDAQGYTVYTSGTGPTVTTFTRAPAGLRAIQAARVLTSEPSGTSVLWRVVLGGVAHYWNGSAWAVASDAASHWCTTAQLEANLATADMTDARDGLAFVASLRTALADRTPYVYGVEMIWAVHRVTTLAAPLRHEVLHEELRIAVKAGIDAQTFAGSEEFIADGTAEISYDGMGDYAINVASIDAVYDVTTDAGMDAALSGTWDSGEKLYTLASAPTAGHRLHVDFRHHPEVSLGGDDDLVTDAMPLVTMSKPALSRPRQQGQFELLAGTGGTTAYVGRAPRVADLAWECRVYARTDTDCEAIVDQIHAWLTGGALDPRKGRTFTLPTDGQVITVHWLGDETPRSRDRYWQQTFRLGAYGVPVYSAEVVGASSITEVQAGTPEVPMTA